MTALALRPGRDTALLRMIGRRVLMAVPTLVLATFVVFGLLHLIPGDPAQAIAGEHATPERLAEIRAQLGLDQPFAVQYLDWLRHAITGDLGSSLSTGESVGSLIWQRLPTTLTLGAAALLVAVALGVPLGVAAALRQGRPADTAITGAATLGIAVPNFWIGMVLVLVFAVQLQWLPATGFVGLTENPVQTLQYVVLPAIALGMVGAAEVCRQLRSALIEVLRSDFMRTHRAKGLSHRTMVWQHALKNAGLPLATIIGLLVSRVLGASVVVETLFAIPGLGTLVVEATTQRDYPVIQGVVLITALLVLLTNLVVDLAYRFIDPRISE
ncbi:ABC transporter permease [Saccharopolyspora elongata]|uniref:ABC transporter permease n=1 Tax=Saccharopolyspora elongata TaxID=2530387 RepID=A0A4R4Z422_9PSEU|nr:ABC transporter permease [Saccharopolyspora elongata]TDD51659.1 ABC transporter permease [Saccharopolyspora elongata]